MTTNTSSTAISSKSKAPVESKVTVELLQGFCSKTKAGISKPFSRGKFTYATDDRILLRVPRLPEVAENREAPNPTFIFSASLPWRRSAFKPLPVLPKVDVEDSQAIQIGGGHFKIEYLRMVARFDGVVVRGPSEEMEPLAFQWPGGIGMLMGMRTAPNIVEGGSQS